MLLILGSTRDFVVISVGFSDRTVITSFHDLPVIKQSAVPLLQVAF